MVWRPERKKQRQKLASLSLILKVQQPGGLYKTITRYYKNGVPVQLSTGSNYIVATSMAIYNNQTYAGGYNADVLNEPIIWKNGVYSIYPSSTGGRVARIRVF